MAAAVAARNKKSCSGRLFTAIRKQITLVARVLAASKPSNVAVDLRLIWTSLTENPFPLRDNMTTAINPTKPWPDA